MVGSASVIGEEKEAKGNGQCWQWGITLFGFSFRLVVEIILRGLGSLAVLLHMDTHLFGQGSAEN